ncbi:MAG: glycosyltransferase [Mycobacterium sp.]
MPQLPPGMSARTVFDRKSVIRIAIVVIPLVALGVTAPQITVVVLTAAISLWYLASTIDRNWLLIKGIRTASLLTVSDADALNVPDHELPFYTVLLPVFDEPSIVQDLIDGVGKLNYPPDKIEVLLLVEEDDLPTRAAAAGIELQSVRIVLVPHSLPKTKPKACNYGMSLTDLRGEMMTIYDAEDIPDPLQLRKVVVALQRLSPDVGCVQCRLGYFNETQNLLTRWFSMEYDQWFGLVLPTVESSKCVVPLGGTSNHMPVHVWRRVGGWDEFNVTEDADLGVRLARHGYRTAMLDSVTLEEANSDVVNWIRQRSRWYKGYLQTMIVHLRHPLQLRREIGSKAILRLINMTGGIPLANAMNLVFWLTMLSWIAGRPHFVALVFPPSTYYLSLLLVVVVTPIAMFIELVVIYTLGKPHLWWASLLTPLYWILQSVAAVKAIYQLMFRPHYWEKTVHGLTEVVPVAIGAPQ